MATTKAFELAQLSALTTVDASGNVTASTNTIANASGHLTLDSVAGDIVLDAHGNQVVFRGSSGQVGFIDLSTGRMDIKSSTADQQMRFQGNDGGVAINAVVLDMANGGRATFNENIVVAGTITGVTDFNSSGDMSVGGDLTVTGDLTVEGTTVTLNTTALDVEDKNITLNYHASNDTSASADGAGITIQDAVDASNDASILWDATNDKFDFSHETQVYGNLSVGIGNSKEAFIQATNSGRVASNPAYSFRSDVDTGMFNPNIDNTIAFATGGTERLRIDGSGDTLFYENNGGTPQVGMHWDYADGRLGIGTTTPDSLLDVNDAGVTDNAWNTLAKFRPDLSDQHAEASIHIQSYPSTTVVADRKAGIQSIDDAGNARALILNKDGGNVGIGGVTSPVTALHVDPGYVTLGTSGGTDNSWINNVEDGNLELVNEGRSTNDGAVRINRKNNPAGDTTYFRDTVIYDGKGSVVLFVDGSEGNVGIGTNSPDAPLHISGTSPHIDVGPQGGNRGKIGYHDLDVIIGSTSSTGEIIFKNNISSTDSPQTSGDMKVKIHDVGMTIYSDTYNILDVSTDTNDDQTSTDGIIKITNGASHTTKAEFRWDESEDLVHVSYGDHGRHVSINSSGNVGIGTGSVSPAHTLDVDGAIATRQVRHSIRPIINLDFSNTKRLDPTITFRRDSERATYYGSDGYLRYASNNEARFDHDPITKVSKGLLIEGERVNVANPYALSLGSINHCFDGLNVFIANRNYAEAPDGTYTAVQTLATTGTSRKELNIRYNAPTTGSEYTTSCYLKPTGDITHITMSRAGGTDLVKFSFTGNSGAGEMLSAGGSARGTIEKHANGWYRLSITVLETTAGNRSTYMSFANTAFSSSVYSGLAGNGSRGLLIWGAQVELGGFASSYIPVQTLWTGMSSRSSYHDPDGLLKYAQAGYPRYDHRFDGFKWVPTGLKLELAATNRVHQNSIPGGAYQSTNTYGKLAPDRSYKAFQNVPNSGTGPGGAACVIWSGVGFANTTSRHTISIYAKGINGFDRVRLHDNNNNKSVIFNLNDVGSFESAGSVEAAHVHFIGDGWYRIGMTYIPATNALPYFQMYSMENGNGSGGFQFFGAQTEEGSEMTSYIPTTTGNVTRTPDAFISPTADRDRDMAYIDVVNNDVWNKDESTIYADSATYIPDYTTGNYNATQYAWSPDSGRIQVRYDNNEGIHAIGYSNTSGSFQNLFTLYPGTLTFARSSKTALSLSNNNYRFSVNGSTVSGTAIDTTTDVPIRNVIPERLYLGAYRDLAGSESLYGTIRRISYYDKQLSDAEIEALTENN